MTPMQQIFLGMGAVATKTYVDDVFSTYLYTGSNTSTAYNNGINLSESGGMVWIKDRDTANEGMIFDTERGVTKYLIPSDNYSEATQASNSLTSFNNNGFTLGNWGYVNSTGPYASWTFRKSPMFDIVTYTGNGTAGRTISHSLGCVPGCIMIKETSGTRPWAVYHQGTGSTHHLVLNDTDVASDNAGHWNDTDPTASVFTVGDAWDTNQDTKTYVAYLFAGGKSTAATARSVEFDGTGDYLSLAASTDFAFGTGDFTVEAWVKYSSSSAPDGVFQISGTAGGLQTANTSISAGHQGSNGNSKWFLRAADGETYGSVVETINVGNWYHVAVVRSSSVTKLYVNGIQKISVSDSTNYSYENLAVGGYYSTDYLCNGDISNFRIVKGTAVYTSSFRPPTEPLTNITNTKLLCCNNSSNTGSTVTPGTITANGDPTASTDSPFDDPAGFTFGENGDQNVIKCGSYVGNETSTEIFLGFEPQWVMIKRTSGTEGWAMFDSMRGIISGDVDKKLEANVTQQETDAGNYVDLTPTGFKAEGGSNLVNDGDESYIYIAIRRSDGYVGKPPELGTDVFAMATGNSSSTIPSFTSNFPVDFVFNKQPASTSNWEVMARLIQGQYLKTNTTDAEASYSDATFDSNVGCISNSGYTSNNQAYMWKRHAGFDVVCYKGNGNNTDGANAHAHSLGKVPEMIWIKSRSGGANSGSTHWSVSHKGLNGGSNPWHLVLRLNENVAEGSLSNFGNTPPTSTHFYVGEPGNGRTNDDGADVIAFLFASVDGISKVGSYDGSASEQTITTGFQPRFVIIKRVNVSGNWVVMDTTRTWGSGNDDYLFLDTDTAQLDTEMGAPTSTGFTVSTHGFVSGSGNKFIYYAHA